MSGEAVQPMTAWWTYRQALDVAGRDLYGDAWTGRERWDITGLDKSGAPVRFSAAARLLHERLVAEIYEAVWEAAGKHVAILHDYWLTETGGTLIRRGGISQPLPGRLMIRPVSIAEPLPRKPTAAEIREAREALGKELKTKKLTRPEQREFIRETFPPKERWTVRQLNAICQHFPAAVGAPRKTRTKSAACSHCSTFCRT